MELKEWLEGKKTQIHNRWYAEVKARLESGHEEVEGILLFLLESLVAILVKTFGDEREAGEEIWQQATHLYGALSVRRGLAAGEVVEEIQLLRTVILRFLLDSSEIDCTDRSFSRGFLAINRLIDLGVARASIAYVDDLFFAHVQGSGVLEGISDSVQEEIRRQLETFRKELRL